jgi:hypothetical protein
MYIYIHLYTCTFFLSLLSIFIIMLIIFLKIFSILRILTDLTMTEMVKKKEIKNHQKGLSVSLENEKNSVEATLKVLKDYTLNSVSHMYAMLPQKFLLLIEGKENNTRKILQKLTVFFYDNKIKNSMITAFGIWKLCLVITKSKMNYTLYSKKAGVHLLVGWIRQFIKKLLFLSMKRYLCANICLYIYRLTFIYTYICMYIYIYIYTYIHMYIHIYIYICIHICLYIYRLTFIYTYMYVYIYLYIYIHMYYIHIYIHIHIHIYVYIYMYTCRPYDRYQYLIANTWA